MIALPLALSVFDVDLVTDLSATVSFAIVAYLIDLEKRPLEGVSPCGVPCDLDRMNELNAFDRWVTENGSQNAKLASDIALGGAMLLPLATAFEDPKDALVGFEAMALSMLATNVLKLAIQRPRPLAYNWEFISAERHAGDARLSFPSGHSSIAFASATAFAVPWIERRDGPARFAGAITAYALASAVAALRVAAGKHFVTDVLAGAVLGIAIGVVVTAAHRGQDMDGR